MFRIVMAAIVALAASACAYGSDVDLAPMQDRIPKRIVVTGDYCKATASSPPYMVHSSEGCTRLVWDQASRSYMMTEGDDDEEATTLAPVGLGGNLFLVQADDDAEAVNGRHKLDLVLSRGGAFLILPALKHEKFVEVAARHPGVSVRVEASDPVITAGEPPAIRAFLKEVAVEALRSADLEDEELTVALRDTAGAPDHEASGMQTMAIIELVTALFSLQADE